MANLRIIYDNAVARRDTLVASTTSGTLIAANLATDIKAEKWRSTTTTATITITWTAAEIIGGVGLAFANLTPQATMRVRGYTNVADSVAAVDSGTVYACANTLFDTFEWGMEPLGENAFTYASNDGADKISYGNAWIDPTACKKILINIDDADNEDGYIEISRLITGTFWEPVLQAGFGVEMLVVDTSKHLRSDAGDLMTDTGTKSRKIRLDVSNAQALDRFRLSSILWGNGLPKPLYISVIPEDEDVALEQTYQVYGKLSTISGVTATTYSRYNIPLEIEEM